MLRLPARCRDCGFVFPSSKAIISGSNIIFERNTERCQKCGGISDVLEGRLSIENKAQSSDVKTNKVTYNGPGFVRNNPQSLTADRLAIIAAVEKALTAALDEKDYEKAYHELNRINPLLALKIKKYTKRSGLVLLIPALMVMLRGCNLTTDVHIDVNELLDQVLVAIENSEPYPLGQSHIEGQKNDEEKLSTSTQKPSTRLPPKGSLKQRPEQRSERKAPRQPGGKRTGRHKK